jgi:AraC-like DNA-binding protein
VFISTASAADYRIQSKVLWPGVEELPATESPRMAHHLRMYAPDASPMPGALYMDDANIDTTWHFHDMHQLSYAFEGDAVMEDSEGRYAASGHIAALIPAGVHHRASLHKVRYVSVYLTREQLPTMEPGIRLFGASPLMREMMKEVLRWPLHGPEAPLRSLFIETLALLVCEALTHERAFALPTASNPRTKRALKFTVQRADAKLSEVCAYAGMSERTLRRAIMAEVGMTWETYRQQSRLVRAISLLSEPGISITDIAAQCGFESPSAFSRAFRLLMNDTPRTYRNRLLSGAAEGRIVNGT